jgi:hypothetical protein
MTWLSHIDIGRYRQKFNLTQFVETGSWHGDGIGRAYDCGYSDVASCDIGIEYVTECREKYPQANIVHSDSLTFFENTLPTINAKTLFWLDAHFPDYYGTDDTSEEHRIPLIPEIELIKKFKPNYENDIIVCDDIRNFKTPQNPRFREGELEDRFLIDVDWDAFINILEDTHQSKLIMEHDGVMVFYPKSGEIDDVFTFRTE